MWSANCSGFSSSRTSASPQDGQPLQRALSEAGINGAWLLGVLPTSGGKSLCFQLPALVRYFRRGLLTVVVSPLQALMKDQVDNLRERTGVTEVAAVYGLLTPPERGAILEQVKMGDIGLLYLAPEQLRNRTVVEALSHREIGCWVFDEAHCLSKWGHDFRPDYLYVSRFIKEQSERNQGFPPAIACYTATAKLDVIEDIQQHFNSVLNRTLSHCMPPAWNEPTWSSRSGLCRRQTSGPRRRHC